jgi:gluconate 5-dehydrogenase
MHIPNPFSLKDKLAVITGGGTGIGFGISKAFAESGARVLILGRREKPLQEAVERLGNGCGYLRFDINKRSEIPGLIDRIESGFGEIDILVNNAGAHLKKLSLETSDEEFDHILQVNLASAFTLTRECVKRMEPRRRGSILFISSMTGLFGMEKVVAYGTSKTAVIGMLRGMVMEYSAFNVRVNALAPGWIQSDMLEEALRTDEERKNRIITRIPFKRFGAGEDIGQAAVFLSSDAAGYITGVVLPVDGGAAYAF